VLKGPAERGRKEGRRERQVSRLLIGKLIFSRAETGSALRMSVERREGGKEGGKDGRKRRLSF